MIRRENPNTSSCEVDHGNKSDVTKEITLGHAKKHSSKCFISKYKTLFQIQPSLKESCKNMYCVKEKYEQS